MDGLLLKKKKKQRKKGHSRSHAGRNDGPARKRYREHFFTGTLGRKAKKILVRRMATM